MIKIVIPHMPHDGQVFHRAVVPTLMLRHSKMASIGYYAPGQILNFPMAGDQSVMFLQMPSDLEVFLKYIHITKRNNPKLRLWFDISDALWAADGPWQAGDFYKTIDFHKILGLFDIVTTTTPYLAEAIKEKYGVEKVHVMPNYVAVPNEIKRSDDAKPFMWFGSVSHDDNLGILMDSLDDELRPLVHFRGSTSRYGIQEEVVLPHDMLSYIAHHCKEALVIPLKNTEFNSYRSAMKLAMAGILNLGVIMTKGVCKDAEGWPAIFVDDIADGMRQWLAMSDKEKEKHKALIREHALKHTADRPENVQHVAEIFGAVVPKRVRSGDCKLLGAHEHQCVGDPPTGHVVFAMPGANFDLFEGKATIEMKPGFVASKLTWGDYDHWLQFAPYFLDGSVFGEQEHAE